MLSDIKDFCSMVNENKFDFGKMCQELWAFGLTDKI